MVGALQPGRIAVVVLAVAVLVAVPPYRASAHTAGSCHVGRSDDRCEQWSAVYDNPAVQPPHRSDQFVTATAVTADAVFASVKNVSLDPGDPYAAHGSWTVLGYDAATGTPTWTAQRRTRTYDAPLDIAVSPDGARVYVTGAAYDAFPVAARDSRVMTVAYDAATGAELWSQSWDARPDATDTGKVVTVSADGRHVFVGGITTTAHGDLDYLTLAYDSRWGRPLWSSTYAGPADHGSDALFGLAAAPDGRHVYATGWSDGVVEYDADYATVAIRTSTGSQGRAGSVAWVARYDGVRADRSDRANAVTVAGDGTVVVTGDSYAPGAGGRTRYDVATVAYSGADGTQLWEARYAGPRPGLDSGVAVTASADVVAVAAQSVGATDDSGHDAVTVLYDLGTGARQWTHREAAPRSSERPEALAVSPEGAVAYLLSTARPVVAYTSLDELVVRAYRMTDGTELWTSRLDHGPGNAVRGVDAAVLPDGRLALVGGITLSQTPVLTPSQNRYDTITAVYSPYDGPIRGRTGQAEPAGQAGRAEQAPARAR